MPSEYAPLAWRSVIVNVEDVALAKAEFLNTPHPQVPDMKCFRVVDGVHERAFMSSKRTLECLYIVDGADDPAVVFSQESL